VYAVSAIGQIPLSGSELEKTARMISTAGDYALFAARKAYSGGEHTREDSDALRAFSDSISTLADNMNRALAQMGDGEQTLRLINAEIERVSLGSEAAGVPEIEYDGKYSPGASGAAPKLLDGMDDVTQGEAAVAAAEFFGLDPAALALDGVRDVPIPVYLFTAGQGGGSEMSIEVARAGGVVMCAYSARSPGTPAISAEDAARAGDSFLERNGLTDMTRHGCVTRGGAITLDYAYSDGGVRCYPDALRVTVALDDGGIIGYECGGYVRNHTDRQLGDAAIAPEDARAGISPGLNPTSNALAVISTQGGGERYCHEFTCEDENGGRVLIYIDAQTGEEAKISLIREDENGWISN
jgi:germination protein YpeB